MLTWRRRHNKWGRRGSGAVCRCRRGGRWPRAVASLPLSCILLSVPFCCHSLCILSLRGIVCIWQFSSECFPSRMRTQRQRLPNGQLTHAVGEACIGVEGVAVVLANCDGAAAWEAQGNGMQSQLANAALTCCTHLSARIMLPCRSVAIGTVGGAMPQSKRVRIWDGRCRCSRRGCCQQRCRCCRAWREYGCRWKLKHILGGMDDGCASGVLLAPHIFTRLFL